MTAVSHDSPIAAPFPCVVVGAEFLATAPCRFVTDVDLDVTPDALFAVLEDERSWPAWVRPGITRVTWTSPRPFGVGTTRTVEMVGGMEVYETFFEWRRGEVMAFALTGATQSVWRSFAERYEVTPLAAGKCRLRWTLAYDPVGGFARVQPLIKPLMGGALKLYLRSLARYCRKHG
jgi:hypothetical protein